MSWDELKHNTAPPQPRHASRCTFDRGPIRVQHPGPDLRLLLHRQRSKLPAAHQRQGLFVLLALLMILLCAVLSLLMNLRVQIKRDDGQIVLQIGSGEKKSTSSADSVSPDETQSALAVRPRLPLARPTASACRLAARTTPRR